MRSEDDAGDGLRISVLGPLVVSRKGVELVLGTGMRPVVFGLLAMHPNIALRRETIIDTLWGSAPPATAVNQVQAHVSRLRRILDQGGSPAGHACPLESFGTSYLLRATSAQLDLLAFRDLGERARAAADRGDLPAACGLYEEALGLWRGDPLAELDPLRGSHAVAELARQRTDLIVEYCDAAFDADLHHRAVPQLRALAAREPLNEKAHAHLMIALARTGHQAAALSVFDELRRRLDDQLGIYPGAELTDAHKRVLQQDLPRKIEDTADDAGSGSAVTNSIQSSVDLHTGGRFPVRQLPPALPDFTGRTAEVAGLASLLAPNPERIGVPVAVISGPPGVGKTALALQVSHLTRHMFPDGQLHVELAGSTRLPRDPGDVLGELLRALGLHGSAIPDSAAERAALFRSQTAGQSILLMADDAGSADQVRSLLPGTAGCAIIVTSRSRLGGLAGAHLHLDPLPHQDAVEMLARIVGSQRVADEANASDRLVSACGCLPLAVRIAGAKLATRPSWPVMTVADAVADQRRRLDELALDDLAFRASVMPSYQALDERTRRAFRLLGLLWPTDVAEWVIAALLGEPTAADVVNLLVDKSLLMPVGTDATGEPRYRLHDLLRDFAIEQLGVEPEMERDAAMLRALTGWLQIAAAADHRLPRVPEIPRYARPADRLALPATAWDHLAANPIAWFTAERLNLVAATRYTCTVGMHEFAARLAAHQAAFQIFQARLDEAEYLWRSVIAAADSVGDRAARARGELQLVALTAERGKHSEALEALEQCLPVFELEDDKPALALALHWRAYCAEEQSLLEQAQRDAERGVDVARRAGDRYSELSSCRVLGMATTRLGNHDDGIASCEDALAIARELHEPYAEWECLHTLASANNVAARHSAAADLCLRAIETARELGYEMGGGYAFGSLGDAYHGVLRYHDAIEAFSRARQIFQDRGMQRGNALCMLKIALAYKALGSYAEATELLVAALPEFRALQLPEHEQRARHALSECSAARSRDPRPDPGPQAAVTPLRWLTCQERSSTWCWYKAEPAHGTPRLANLAW